MHVIYYDVVLCGVVIVFPAVVVAGGRGSTAEDFMNYYLPVIMAEMKAPVSTRGEITRHSFN